MFYNWLIIVDSLSKHNGNFWSYTEAQTTSFRISRCTTDWYVDYAFVRDVNPPRFICTFTPPDIQFWHHFPGQRMFANWAEKDPQEKPREGTKWKAWWPGSVQVWGKRERRGKANNTRWDTSLLLQLPLPQAEKLRWMLLVAKWIVHAYNFSSNKIN